MSHMSDDSQHPLLPFQAMVHTTVGETLLDYTAMHKVYETTVNPAGTYFLKRRLNSTNEATPDILSSPVSSTSFITVTPSPSDRSSSHVYKMRSLDDSEDGDDETNYTTFDDNDVKMEYTRRHPGTSVDGDVEDGVDAEDKYPHYRMNDDTSPITTVAAEHLYGIAFAGAGGVVSDLKAAYDCQLSARIDAARKALNLDCFEYKPSCVDVLATGGDRMPLPTYGDMKKFEDSFHLGGRARSAWDSDEESLDADDDEMKETVKPRSGGTFDMKDLMKLTYQASIGNFVNSRVLRVRIPLGDVVGIRLMGKSRSTSDTDESKDDEEKERDAGAVLILEINQPLGSDAFAARMVHSRYHKENEFALIEDWTPNKVCSRSSRIYLYGNMAEMKQTATLLATICPHIASMLSSSSSETNTLNASASLDYAASPGFADSTTDESHADKKQKIEMSKKKGYVMAPSDVEQLLVDTKLVGTLARAREVNPCLKKAILLGHIKLGDNTTKKTVIFEGSCVHCDSSLKCTIGNALCQSTYGGSDYCDGGEDAGVKCASCRKAMGAEYCGGNYVTGLCRNDFEFDSGKFHNHCCECDDFGICMGDYREGHCPHCGDHYFVGNSGFPCPSCGGGKSKDLTKISPPPLSAWDGRPDNAMEVFQAQNARRPAAEQMIMNALVLGGEGSGGSGRARGVMDDAMFDSVFGQLVSQLADAGDGDSDDDDDSTDGGRQGQAGGAEECRQM
mmetsp:Transcript_28298/g.61605  ORF Transcript_28298/g.61605 Transcript_28298/m.61605 type:complete len:732 (-) Transcript_28298:192-2387(-)|eukprot:CAMPEP_0178651456 /NCGR_PEP_ID=MMETSP0698-20121128/22119_1 /TAXON_ID=265572 /ORGANISM="Extubocellulus spinifer, Strain CCMP396" /LENGTH=731 /DNA_ID=CAMNT_0020293083 /DNA_START=113 /DNA_END=2308 /DNA_ORIENTATION=+